MKTPKIGDIISWDCDPHLVIDIEPATKVTYKLWLCYNMLTGTTQRFVREEFTEYEWELLA